MLHTLPCRVSGLCEDGGRREIANSRDRPAHRQLVRDDWHRGHDVRGGVGREAILLVRASRFIGGLSALAAGVAAGVGHTVELQVGGGGEAEVSGISRR